jgi:alkylation response protein AidB-like acyl-CoA dehydrogenase
VRRRRSSRANAKAFSGDHAMRIRTDAVQIFGGYGYMKECPWRSSCATPSSCRSTRNEPGAAHRDRP